MLYNRTQIHGSSMPLLMGFTQPTKIECDETPVVSYYDPISQTISIQCGRYIGTKCLKSSFTHKKHPTTGCRMVLSDKKNEIDDKKFVN